jgi:hypothetical protein
LSQGLLNKVIGQQANPIGTVSGSVHHDDNDPRVAVDAQGTLELANQQIVFSEEYAYNVGVVVNKSSPQIIDKSPFGDDVVIVKSAEFTVTASALTVDLAASAAAGGGRVILRAGATVSYSTVSYPLKTIEPLEGGAPLYFGPLGDLYTQLGLPLGPILVSAGSSSSTAATSATGELVISTTLAASTNSMTRAIDVTADMGGATTTFTSTDAEVNAFAGSIERAVGQSLAKLSSPGGHVLIAPRLSLVGQLAAAGQVSEISISAVDVGVLPASGAHPACLWVAVRLAGTAGTAAAPQNFLEADYAYLCSERVIRAICAYRWRTGEYPTGYPLPPRNDTYKGNATIKQIVINTWLVQTDIVDAQQDIVGDITPWSATTVRSEDYVEIGGHAYGAIDSVTDTNGTPVAQAIRDKYGDTEPFDYRVPLFFSNVGPPNTSGMASFDAYLVQLRAKVSGQFSRPFVGAPTVALQKRAVNGNEKLMLTHANITAI